MAVLFALVLIARAIPLTAQNRADNQPALDRLTWSTDSTGPRRFVSVHGRRSAVFGYPQDGLELWAYPVQILSRYSVTFCTQGTTTGIAGNSILRRIVYKPESVIRIYAGPDFVVRETLFVPLDEPGIIITYEVAGTRAVDITIRFTPVLDLMWPASVGGQETLWNSEASAYVLTEPTHRFAASVGSPNIVAHDDTPNSAKNVAEFPGLAFTMRSERERHSMRVIVAGGASQEEVISTSKGLAEHADALYQSAVGHYSDLLTHTLQIETPDPEINRTLAWSQIALDQAWVCSPDLGCAIVAGYGPSRDARRPQYDWFFAGDGMVAIQGLLTEGQYSRARQELDFILSHRDRKTGMIWHEISQSAPWLDWEKYPFLYLHVDLTYQFLGTVNDYVSATGDRDFIKANWPAIRAAYEYGRSLVDPKDGLPHIPLEKRGEREQDALSDELALSAGWANAAQAFANLAAAMGDNAASQEAQTEHARAKEIIGQRYWNDERQFWITGYTRSGIPLMDRNIGPAEDMSTLFTEAQRNSVMNQLASSDFQADWGTRGNASSANSYEPNSYTSGSVWATGSAGVASAFWAEHRPATALPIWSALVPWSSLDSLGHIHEALAGDFYHEEIESVPEQTWSSSSFLSTFVNGLLGLRVEALKNRVIFAPHLPPNWSGITLRNVQAGSSRIDLVMNQNALQLQLEMRNEGPPVRIVFNPGIPLGATLRSAHVNEHSAPATIEAQAQDTHARMEFDLPHGSSNVEIAYSGGVSLILPPSHLQIGDPSKAIKIASVSLRDNRYTVNFDHLPSSESSFEVRTPWTIKSAQGATCLAIAPNLYKITIKSTSRDGAAKYQQGTIFLTLGGVR